MAFIYSWPTYDRLPVVVIPSGRMLNISPEEVSDTAELQRLSGILAQLEVLKTYEQDPIGDVSRF